MVRVWVDAETGLAWRGDEALALSPQELALLRALATGNGRVMGRHELRRAMGLVNRDLRRCDSVVAGLRRTLGPEAMVTVRGRGWRCVADVVATDLPA